MSNCRAELTKWLNDRRKENLKKTADQYAKLPPNIRAAVARVAGVGNERLDSLTAKERAAMMKAVCELRKQLDSAYRIILVSQVTE